VAIWAIKTYINPLLPWILRDVVVFVGLFAFIAMVAMVSIWAERKVAGHIQSRLGPMRTGGWHGWSQSLADGLKLMMKEDLIPASADRTLFRLAPYLSLAPSFAAYVVIPFGFAWALRDIDVSLLVVLGLLSIDALALILAGWASNSKWSLYGGMREACQLVSYEIPMGLSLLVPVMIVGSLRLMDFGQAQSGGWFDWLIFSNPFAFFAFFTYFIASLASCKRTPFDLPEGESELVAGFHIEYSGFRFAMFFFAEYAALFVVSALATTLFLGGWNCPTGLPYSSGPILFVIKCSFLIYIQMWLRWTLPRIRIDQVMHACMKFLLPVAIVVFLGSAVWVVFAQDAYPTFKHIAEMVRIVLGVVGLIFPGAFIALAVYGFAYRYRLVGNLARKHLPGA